MSKVIVNNLVKIFLSSVTAVLPQNLIRTKLNYNPTTESLSILDDVYNLKNKNVYVVGAGKAVQQMAAETEKLLGSKIKKGIVSIPVGSKIVQDGVIEYFGGAKDNLPDKQAEDTTIKIKKLVENLSENDFLIVLISGGGSALLTLPSAPISLEEKMTLVKSLANSGADIEELNVVRKKISDIKGGKLSVTAQPAQTVSLILSDIVNDPVDLIASGPTVKDPSTIDAAKDIINKYKLIEKLPKSIENTLNKTTHINFPDHKVKNYIIGSNRICLDAAMLEAQNLNYFSIDLSHSIVGFVNNIAYDYADYCHKFCTALKDTVSGNIPSVASSINASWIDPKKFAKRSSSDINKEIENGICFILGGEPTVKVTGSGKGGRNQQLALEFSYILHERKNDLKDFDIYLLSAGTDGIDGPTDAAGAIGYIDLVEDATKAGLNVANYIKSNDSYNFYKKFMDGKYHIITGHTGTNVMDLHLILIKKK